MSDASCSCTLGRALVAFDDYSADAWIDGAKDEAQFQIFLADYGGEWIVSAAAVRMFVHFDFELIKRIQYELLREDGRSTSRWLDCLLDPMGGGHYKWPLRATFCSAVFVTNSYSSQY